MSDNDITAEVQAHLPACRRVTYEMDPEMPGDYLLTAKVHSAEFDENLLLRFFVSGEAIGEYEVIAWVLKSEVEEREQERRDRLAKGLPEYEYWKLPITSYVLA